MRLIERDTPYPSHLFGGEAVHKTKKAIATAKRLWDRYVICACRLRLRGVTERTADDVSSGIVSILVSMPIHTFWKANITTLSPGLIGSTVRPRRRRTMVLVYTGSDCTKPTASWLSSLGLKFGGSQPIFRNFSSLANISSRETGSVQCGRGGTGQVCSGTFIT